MNNPTTLTDPSGLISADGADGGCWNSADPAGYSETNCAAGGGGVFTWFNPLGGSTGGGFDMNPFSGCSGAGSVDAECGSPGGLWPNGMSITAAGGFNFFGLPGQGPWSENAPMNVNAPLTLQQIFWPSTWSQPGCEFGPCNDGGGAVGEGFGSTSEYGNAQSPCSYLQAGASAANVLGPGGGMLGLGAFRRGGSLDAQAHGASTGYANYAYGIYMAAAGYSLKFALWGADTYAWESGATNVYIANGYLMYGHNNVVNIANIEAGYAAANGGGLCR